MKIVRRQIEQIWAEHPPGYEPEGFIPYDTGETAVEIRFVLNRFETYILRAWQAVAETVLWRSGRVACRVFGHHNLSCRGRTDHRPAHRLTRRAL